MPIDWIDQGTDAHGWRHWHHPDMAPNLGSYENECAFNYAGDNADLDDWVCKSSMHTPDTLDPGELDLTCPLHKETSVALSNLPPDWDHSDDIESGNADAPNEMTLSLSIDIPELDGLVLDASELTIPGYTDINQGLLAFLRGEDPHFISKVLLAAGARIWEIRNDGTPARQDPPLPEGEGPLA